MIRKLIYFVAYTIKYMRYNSTLMALNKMDCVLYLFLLIFVLDGKSVGCLERTISTNIL